MPLLGAAGVVDLGFGVSFVVFAGPAVVLTILTTLTTVVILCKKVTLVVPSTVMVGCSVALEGGVGEGVIMWGLSFLVVSSTTIVVVPRGPVV